MNPLSFTRGEISRNLLGGLETALFMPSARARFGNTPDEALRSFVIPIALLPVTLLAVYLSPRPELADHSANVIALLYVLRLFASWAMFLGSVYFLARNVDRNEYFCQFVIAANWLAVPATIIFLPVIAMLLTGVHVWEELYPFMVCLALYAYAFTAYMAAKVLRVPWELAAFVAVIALMSDNYSSEMVTYLSSVL
jgi:hypothetical protein